MTENLNDNYARANYHSAQQWGQRPALLLIDFAQAYFDPEQPLFGGEGCQTALDNAAKLAPIARKAGIPVIFTEVKYIPCLLYTSPSPRDATLSRMPSSA